MRKTLREIAALDPVADAQRIYRLSAGFEFPFDYRRSLELALFRTYCVPSISALLDRTGEFAARPQQRYDDTALLMAEIAEHGCDSPRGRAALRKINRLHGRYVIANDDLRYVLSTFVFEPIDWIDAYGWRRLHEHERLAAFHHYREIGRRMGIAELPADPRTFRAFKERYEAEHFAYSDANARVGRATLELFAGWFPRPLRPLARQGVLALLDPPMLAAFGFPRPWPGAGPVVRAAIRARRIVRHFPERTRSKLTREPRNRTYPGYPERWDVADLGAP